MDDKLTILGVMSGTSLDGIDLALCSFFNGGDSYKFEILNTQCIEYDSDIKKQLSQAHLLHTVDFLKLHKKYGYYLGKKISNFLHENEKPDFIASHGHTVFHEPSERFTFQIGDGAFIAAETGISVISDFRNLDTALYGQGAPLVPVGDKLLFPEYEYCINLGGFANISYDLNDERIAYDICPVNFILNRLSDELGLEFDKNGEIGKQGSVNDDLLNELNGISYYTVDPPKSLARENVENDFLPILNKYDISVYDKMRTYYEHLTTQILKVFPSEEKHKVLLTGGGAHNQFLTDEFRKRTKHELIIPDKKIIDFKEALIFAFLGYLRINNKINTLSSVTGAKENSSGGSIYRI